MQGEFAQGEGGGRRPGGGAADAGEARISRPEGGLACGPCWGSAEIRKGAAPAGTALLMQVMQVLFSGSSFQLAVLQQLERKRNADE